MFSSARKRLLAITLATATVLGGATAMAPEAGAIPRDGSCPTHVDRVYSASMGKRIPVCVVGAGRRGAGTLYLLDGLRGPNNNSGWLIETRVASFMRGKGVNVAIPYAGGGTFYTDWERRDPRLGRVKWETFLTKELPRHMRGKYGASATKNGVAGLSMSGTSALNLASRHPNFYRAVASYSGYPTVTMPGFNQGIQFSVAEMGGNATNMWGTWPGGQWAANDPFLTAGNLAGKRVYISSGSGLGSKYDSSLMPGAPGFNAVRFAQMVPLEVAASVSSQLYIARVAAVPGVRLTTKVTPDGDHWWTYWNETFRQSWNTTFKGVLR
ncbi:MAG: alpha/beta hydrolase family protein [Gordonia sp. (in: high G+C Gram-positive bacteria)]|uniref:alpha/beta hydrolase n=1 Tax=Gordonia sp. (in: high G+C Gram-positive bacteria) TaxID=84139 RepID=UPI0039E37665